MVQTENLGTMKRSAKFVIKFVAVISVAFLLFQLLTLRIGSDRSDGRKPFARSQINAFGTALDLFKADNGHYPTGPNALQELVTAPVGATNWHPYLDSIPLDPWQQPYVYECPGKHHTNAYDIFSTGPDARAGTKDDIGNW